MAKLNLVISSKVKGNQSQKLLCVWRPKMAAEIKRRVSLTWSTYIHLYLWVHKKRHCQCKRVSLRTQNDSLCSLCPVTLLPSLIIWPFGHCAITLKTYSFPEPSKIKILKYYLPHRSPAWHFLWPSQHHEWYPAILLFEIHQFPLENNETGGM